MHRLGIDVALMGKIGEDLFGRAILDIMRGYGEALVNGMVVTPGAVSSYTLVINPPGLDRAFLHCPGANDAFGADDVRYDMLNGARLFHFGYPVAMGRFYVDDGEELVAMYRRAKATGVTTSLDTAMPDAKGASGRVNWRAMLTKTLPYVDVFVPSFDELLFMLARERFDELDAAGEIVACDLVEDVQALGDEALRLGAKVVLLKLGSCGAYLRAGAGLEGFGRAAPHAPDAWIARELWAPCFRPDQVAGTVGSGDATIAGFLAALLRGLGPEEALQMATAVGASCVEVAGSLYGVRSWEETAARIAAGWPRADAPLNAAGWHWDEARHLWFGPRDLG
jgi:sugar/nucleoside kinase (ribokinase family)